MDALKLITAGKTALDGIKQLNQYAGEIQDIQKRGEFMRIIGLLSIELAETQIENSENKLRIKALQEEIEKLKTPEFKLVWEKGFYYKENEDEKYCSGCYDNENKLIRVILEGTKTYGELLFCPICKTEYKHYKY